ncbi:MAG: hypothetical protein AAF936_06685 [Pseudomonadota bacterium]
MTTGNHAQTAGKGLVLPGLAIGLITGLLVYGVVEFWIDDVDDKPLPIAVLGFIVTAAASYLLLAERDQLGKALGGALLIGTALVLPDYAMANVAGDETKNLSSFPPMLWFIASRGLVVFLLLTLVKASLDDGAPPRYERVFFHGLTMPLIAGGAKLFALLAMLLLFAWARLLKELDVHFFNELFQEPWFLLPFLGAIGGASIALMRGQQSVLGALRFILLLLARMLMMITALFTITLLIVLATKGVDVVFERPYPSAWMLGLALLGMLIFNGVYQNGEGGPPPLWLRLPTLITLIGFPVYALLAFYAFSLRIGDYGLTPPRIGGLVVTGLTAAYSLVCIAGLLTEVNWRGRKWMPLVGSLNTIMAIAWIIALTALATPIINPWAISATSQFNRIANQTVAAEDFDFGYLRFELGQHGEKALDRMRSLNDHPEAAAIRNGVERARAAKSYWEYKNPDAYLPTVIPEPDENAVTDGPMSLELNPDEASEAPPDEE